MSSQRRPSWFEELTRPPASIPAGVFRPAPLLLDAEHQPITTREGWQARRAELRSAWGEYLGGIDSARGSGRIEVLEEDRSAGITRRLVRYEAEPGLPVEAYVLSPLDPPDGQMPGVVVLHSTFDGTIRQPAGLDGPADKHIGLHLARRGYVAFCPRCFLWQYGKPGRLEMAVEWLASRHPGVRGMAKMLHDARRAADLLAVQPGVDPARIGAIGHSLGAKEALYLAAFDERIQATVSSEGGISLPQSNWDAPWYLGPEARRPGFPLDHSQILAMVAPRAFLLIAGDSADGPASWPTVEAALPVWSLMDAGGSLGFLDHHEGHAFPAIAQERSYAWLDHHLPSQGR